MTRNIAIYLFIAILLIPFHASGIVRVCDNDSTNDSQRHYISVSNRFKIETSSTLRPKVIQAEKNFRIEENTATYPLEVAPDEDKSADTKAVTEIHTATDTEDYIYTEDYIEIDPEDYTDIDTGNDIETDTFSIENSSMIKSDSFSTEYEDLKFRDPFGFRLKTNLVPWVAAISNLEGEILFHPHLSVAVSIWYCPWKISNNYSLKVIGIFPEWRAWFRNDWRGHYLGIHLTGAWYNLRYRDIRYQDVVRPALGVGVTYGYTLMCGRHWGFDFSIGAGWLSMKYDRYHNISNGALIDTRRTNYWGVDRIAISLVYNLE